METALVRIRLLGGFSLSVGDERVPERAWRLRKARTLVKLVALAPERRLHRERVAELLWGDRDLSAAANNFHQALHAARRALDAGGAEGGALLAIADQTLVLAPDAWVDVVAFEAAAEAARAGHDPEAHRAALALYAGELLPEDRYESWAEPRREALRELHIALSVELAAALEGRGTPGEAVTVLQRAVLADPLHEEAHRALMRLHVRTGRRQQALAQYGLLRQALRRELEAEPDPVTRALYRDLLAGQEPALDADHDSPCVSGPTAHNLPIRLTSFVGRSRELADIARLLERTRLLTLTGPGGCGKTRLALEAADARLEHQCDGAWFVELAGLADATLVAQVTATALGVPIPAHRSALEALAAYLAGRDALVVLDNCEHLVEACSELAEHLLVTGPAVRILATSREPLRCPGEVAWRVPSLSLPDRDGPTVPASLREAEAVRLLIERVASVRGGFVLGDADGPAAAEVCWRLDGIPLAIELAAARAGALSLSQIAGRLGNSLDVLTSGSRTARTRQQTLRDTIAWSHDLLEDEERELFRRLAVFQRSFVLDAAEEVCAHADVSPKRVADLLARLVEKSLVVAEEGPEPRFGLLDTIHQFARERLAASDEHDAVSMRHVGWCLRLAAEHDPLTTANDRRSLARLEAEHDNLRAALAFALRRDPRAALQLATRLWRFWLDRSYFAEGTRWLDAVLAAAPEDAALRGEALLARAGLALRRGESEIHLHHAREAVRACRMLGDQHGTAEALYQHAIFEVYASAPARAAELFSEALSLATDLGNDNVSASALHASALISWYRCDLPATRARVEEALSHLERLPADDRRFFQGVTFGMVVLPEGPGGRPRLVWEETVLRFHRYSRDQAIAYALNNLAWVARAEDDPNSARTALEEATSRFRAISDPSGEALTLAHRGHLMRSVGELEAGRRWFEESLALRRKLGERRETEMTILGLALLEGTVGDRDLARRHLADVRERFEKVDDMPAMAGSAANWAIVEERAGDLERARDLYAEAGRRWEMQRSWKFSAWARLGLAETSLALGDECVAATVIEDVRSTFAQLGEQHGLAAAHKAAQRQR